MPEKHPFFIKTVYEINVTCGVCVIYVGGGVCVSSYLRDMEDNETIRLVSRVFSTGWAVHTGNEPEAMKFMRMEVEVLWFQLFCKTRTEKIR